MDIKWIHSFTLKNKPDVSIRKQRVNLSEECRNVIQHNKCIKVWKSQNSAIEESSSWHPKAISKTIQMNINSRGNSPRTLSFSNHLCASYENTNSRDFQMTHSSAIYSDNFYIILIIGTRVLKSN